ncbi:hypothetical protein BJV77DRAFT_983876 [Russula vinacea]|nr:hypothetical protein BJV77DRAFT_983876 [Russula vinacea]
MIMDYDNSSLKSSHSYVYADTPNSNLLCCICRMPFVDPTTSRTCAHSFCRDCIGPALQANPIVRHMVDELAVECLNREAGCQFTCQRQLLAVHLRMTASSLRNSAPIPSVRERRSERTFLGDNPLCPHRLVLCDSCATEMEAVELGVSVLHVCNLEHSHSETVAHAEVCPAAIVACEQAAHGCDWMGTHVRDCPYVALRGFFGISDAQAGALRAENARLRARLDSVEGMLAVMRHELQAVKGALGPWYRPDAAEIMLHMPITPGEDPSSILLDSVPHATHAGITRSDLAAYFPPPSGDASAPPPLSSSTTSGHSLSAALTALRTALLNHDARSRMAANAHAASLRRCASGANADGTGVGAGGWNAPARFFSNPPPPLGVNHGIGLHR